MTLPEIGDIWQYKSDTQRLIVLVLGIKNPPLQYTLKDGMSIRCLNLVCENFSQEHDEWWFSTAHTAAKCWRRLA